MTFFSAPPSSTPTTSSCVYTRKRSDENARLHDRGELRSADAARPRRRARRPRSRSWAESATASCSGSSVSTTSVIIASVSRSIPLLATTIVASSGTASAWLRSRSRSTCDGGTYVTTSASRTAARRSSVARRPAWSGAPARNRSLRWRSLIDATTSGSRAQRTTSWPLRANRSASAVPHAPAPITAHRVIPSLQSSLAAFPSCARRRPPRRAGRTGSPHRAAAARCSRDASRTRRSRRAG